MASGLGHFFPPPSLDHQTVVNKQPPSSACLPTPNILLLSSVPAPSSPSSSLFLTFLRGGGEGQENSTLPFLVQVLT